MYIQIHLLRANINHNLNADITGRPKTSDLNGSLRGRFSSQSMKRNLRVRTEDDLGLNKEDKSFRTLLFFKEALITQMEQDRFLSLNKTRAKALYVIALKSLPSAKEDSKEAVETEDVSPYADLPDHIQEIYASVDALGIAAVFLSGYELSYWDKYLTSVFNSYYDALEDEDSENPTKDDYKSLSFTSIMDELYESDKDVKIALSIALFGRMFASNQALNVDGALYMSNAVTINKVLIEEDFFTLVDDLKKDSSGAAHLGSKSFTSGVYYTHVVIDVDHLVGLVLGDSPTQEEKYNFIIELEGVVAGVIKHTNPTGQEHGFASFNLADYAACEVGEDQPNSCSNAFLLPVSSRSNILADGVQKLEDMLLKTQKLYSKTSSFFVLNLTDYDSDLPCSESLDSLKKDVVKAALLPGQ